MADTDGIGKVGEQIERLAKEAIKLGVVELKGDRPGNYFLVKPDGTYVRIEVAAGWHDEKLATPDQLKEFIIAEHEEDSAIFLADERIVFVKDLEDRRDKATCDLRWTPHYHWLAKESGDPMTQDELIRVLRITLKGAIPEERQLLNLVRKLKFEAGKMTDADIQHGRQSLGKSVTASINAEHELPEEILLQVPIFENHRFAAPVRCAIEVFPALERFKLTPYPLELRSAMDNALDDIVATLKDSEVPIYRGKPS